MTTVNGRPMAVDKPWALFVMLKEPPDTPGTDAGWTYATLTPDGREITSSGSIPSCMGCHQKTRNDRMFGPSKL